MPKRVDHQERRQQIADAICRLLGREGLDAVSLRQVAAEAGVSMGRVQHYFATKDEMLSFAFRAVAERAERRIGAVAAAVEQPATPRSLLRAVLLEMLPLSPQSRFEAPVWVATLGKAVLVPEVAVPLRDDADRFTDFVAEQITGVRGDGADARRDAQALLALVDGLMVHLLVGQLDEETATALLDHQLDLVLGQMRQMR
ncbi:MAG: TetR family transcriptional regulator C-terminal domain-containing protein [Streptosporangiales bacterium]|nr:TetR family transcriptional regulator C-terminal domain-containing protein [Streptosporangiales bacterium]